MSHTDDFGAIDSHEMDLLVDGQLSDEQRRSLLSRLEASPDGWRQCALAFLEAQSWRECVTAMTAQVETELPATPAPRRTGQRVPSLLAWAAVALLAFTLGWSVAGFDGTMGGGTGPAQAVRPDGPSPVAANRDQREADATYPSDDGYSPNDPTSTPTTLATFTIPGENEGAAPVHVPVYDGPAFDETWLRGRPSVLPEYVLEQLQRRGFQVLQHRRLYPFELQDGRHLVLPVDEVNVRFVGYESF